MSLEDTSEIAAAPFSSFSHLPKLTMVSTSDRPYTLSSASGLPEAMEDVMRFLLGRSWFSTTRRSSFVQLDKLTGSNELCQNKTEGKDHSDTNCNICSGKEYHGFDSLSDDMLVHRVPGSSASHLSPEFFTSRLLGLFFTVICHNNK